MFRDGGHGPFGKERAAQSERGDPFGEQVVCRETPSLSGCLARAHLLSSIEDMEVHGRDLQCNLSLI